MKKILTAMLFILLPIYLHSFNNIEFLLYPVGWDNGYESTLFNEEKILNSLNLNNISLNENYTLSKSFNHDGLYTYSLFYIDNYELYIPEEMILYDQLYQENNVSSFFKLYEDTKILVFIRNKENNFKKVEITRSNELRIYCDETSTFTTPTKGYISIYEFDFTHDNKFFGGLFKTNNFEIKLTSFIPRHEIISNTYNKGVELGYIDTKYIEFRYTEKIKNKIVNPIYFIVDIDINQYLSIDDSKY